MALPNKFTGKAISSNITVVPFDLTAPTAGNNPLRTFHKKSLFSVSLVNSGVFKSENSFVIFWDVNKQVVLERFDVDRFGDLYAIAYSYDGRWLASGGFSGRIRLW